MPKSGNARRWSADYDFYAVYADDKDKRLLGQVVETRDGRLDAFDMTKMNESRERLYCIGHYKTRSTAKRAVEEYWADRDRDTAEAGEGRKQ